MKGELKKTADAFAFPLFANYILINCKNDYLFEEGNKQQTGSLTKSPLFVDILLSDAKFRNDRAVASDFIFLKIIQQSSAFTDQF